VFVSPYHEEPIEDLVELIGASQVLFGSDYPHAEGLADPTSFASFVKVLPRDYAAVQKTRQTVVDEGLDPDGDVVWSRIMEVTGG